MPTRFASVSMICLEKLSRTVCSTRICLVGYGSRCGADPQAYSFEPAGSMSRLRSSRRRANASSNASWSFQFEKSGDMQLWTMLARSLPMSESKHFQLPAQPPRT